jgi:hypothetical protein
MVTVQWVVEVAMGDQVNLVEGDLGVVGVIVEEEMVSVLGMVTVTDMPMHIATRYSAPVGGRYGEKVKLHEGFLFVTQVIMM